MAIADDLDQERAALVVVKPEPFNAEAPPEALRDAITPTALHFVRSNFALPVHDGRLEIDGAVRNEMTLTLEDLRAMTSVERAVTLECAGNGRIGYAPLPSGEPWDRYAVSTARWTGARLSEVLALAQPLEDAVDVAFEGADHGPHEGHEDVAFVRALGVDHATDPATEVLIAYEMNGEPLTRDHGAPFRLIVPGWYGVASVKWLNRITILTERFAGDFQTNRYVYEWPDRPHEPVTHTRVRARITEPVNGGADHRRHVHRSGKGMVRHGSGHAGRSQPERRRGVARRGGRARASDRTSGRTGHSSGRRRHVDAARSAPAPRTPPGIRSPRSRPGTGSGTATTPSRSARSTCAEDVQPQPAWRHGRT